MPKSITKQEVENLKKDNIPYSLIDIRSVTEFSKMHIPGAINIPMGNLDSRSVELYKESIFICVCNHGKERSQRATEELESLGIKDVYYLEGGTSGWMSAT